MTFGITTICHYAECLMLSVLIYLLLCSMSLCWMSLCCVSWHLWVIRLYFYSFKCLFLFSLSGLNWLYKNRLQQLCLKHDNILKKYAMLVTNTLAYHSKERQGTKHNYIQHNNKNKNATLGIRTLSITIQNATPSIMTLYDSFDMQSCNNSICCIVYAECRN